MIKKRKYFLVQRFQKYLELGSDQYLYIYEIHF